MSEQLGGRAANSLWRTWLVLLVVCAVSVPLCIRYVDRPLADFCNVYIARSAVAGPVSLSLGALRPLVLVAFLVLLVSGLRVFSGGRRNALAPLVKISLLSLIVSIAGEFILKQIFGRSDVEPTYLVQHLYGFDFLHARDGWWSFPSGTAMGLFAIVGVLHAFGSRWKMMGTVAAGVICTAVTLLNYHWVSDMIAGAFIGLTIGYALAGLLASDHLTPSTSQSGAPN